MRFTKVSAWLLAFGLGMPCAASAASMIQARSEVEATVIMDGTPVGTTPINISQVPPGDHEIAFQAVGTRTMRAYRVRMPAGAPVTALVTADFGYQEPVVVEATPIVAAPPIVLRRVCAPPVVRAAPVFVVGRRHHHRRRHYDF